MSRIEATADLILQINFVRYLMYSAAQIVRKPYAAVRIELNFVVIESCGSNEGTTKPVNHGF